MLTDVVSVKYIHKCLNPALFGETWIVDVGSLWQCDYCGREWIKVEKDSFTNLWRYTVEIVDKRVQKARNSKNATI